MDWRQAEDQIIKDFIRSNDPFGGTSFADRLRLYSTMLPGRTRLVDVPRRAERSLQDYIGPLRTVRDHSLISTIERQLLGEGIKIQQAAPKHPRIEEFIGPDTNVTLIDVDVQHYSAEELLVKVMGRFVIVQGQHNQRQEKHCWATRSFIKKYKMPDNVNMALLFCEMSADNFLTIGAPVMEDTSMGCRVVPIRMGGIFGGLMGEPVLVGAIPMAAGPMAAGPMAAGPMAAGTMAAGPMAAGPMAAGPMAAGPMAAGPMAAGRMAAGPMAAGPMAAGPMPMAADANAQAGAGGANAEAPPSDVMQLRANAAAGPAASADEAPAASVTIDPTPLD